jgi:hypothetical protein
MGRASGHAGKISRHWRAEGAALLRNIRSAIQCRIVAGWLAQFQQHGGKKFYSKSSASFQINRRPDILLA